MAQFTQTASNSGGVANYWDAHFSDSNYFVLGQKDGNGRNGAVRFTNVTIPQAQVITSAQLSIAGEYVAGSTNLIIRTNGIDEDNTSSFSSDPMGRAETTAQTNSNGTMPGAGNYFNVDVTAQVQEIVNRAGWASGNAMGFHMNDNGTANGTHLEDDEPTGINTILTINYAVNSPSASRSLSPSASISSSVSPSLSPSPSQSPSASVSSSVSPSIAPPFVGMKVAKSGINALIDTNPQNFIFDSHYGTLKYYTKQTVTISFTCDPLVAVNSGRGSYSHNLGYYPFAEVFVSVNGGNYESCPFFGSGASTFYDGTFIITQTAITVYGEVTGIGLSSSWTFDFLIFIFKNNLQL